MTYKKTYKTGAVQQGGLTINSLFDAYPDQILSGSYSSDRQMATIPCLGNGTITYQGNANFTTFGESISFNELLDQLLVASSSQSNLWVFSSNPEAIYAKSVNDTLYTQSYYFAAVNSLPTAIFTPSGKDEAVLNSFGQSAYKAGADIFRTMCGDMVAVEEKTGSGLFLTMQLNFDRQADKAAFINEAGASFSSINTTYSAIETYMNKNNPVGNLELLAFQSGGDATQLSDILSKNPATGNYYLTTCDFSSIANCQGAMNAIYAYANTQFPNQVSFSNQPSGNAISREFVYENYTNFGLNVGASVLTPATISARDEIVQLYLDMKAEMVLVNQVLNSQFGTYTEPVTQAIFNNFTTSVNYNNGIITDSINGITGCYVRPAYCSDIVANINNQLASIDMGAIDNILDGFKTGYKLTQTVEIAYKAAQFPINYIPIGSEMFLPIDGINLPVIDSFTWLYSQQSIALEGDYTILKPQTSITSGCCGPFIDSFIMCMQVMVSLPLVNATIPWQETAQCNVILPMFEGVSMSGSCIVGLSAIDSEIF